MHLLLSHWIFLGAVLAMWFALQMATRHHIPQPSSRLYGTSMLVALAWMQASYWLRVNDLSHAWPFLHYLHQPMMYAVGPLFYFYSESLQGNAPNELRSRRHLAPALFLFVLSIWQWWWHSPDSDMALSTWIYCLSFGTGALYAGRVMRSLRSFSHPDSLILTELAVLKSTVALGICVVILALMGSLLRQEWFFPLHASAITALMVLVFLLQQRYPDVGNKIEAEIVAEVEQRSKPRPPLSTLNVQDALSRLKNMMEIEKRYTDETLDLPSLAGLLDLSTHQLSQLINEHLGVSYTRFIKSYRIAAAKRMLLEHPDETVLNIALQTGFNSLSSFHAAFKELEGLSPGAFRKQ